MRVKIFMAKLLVIFLLVGCNALDRTQKGAIIGTGGGAAVGAVIGEATGNTALGAIVGATVGGAAGAVIGNKMDQQAEEMEKELDDAKIERVGEGILVEFEGNVLYGFDSTELSDTAKTNLRKLADILNKYPDTDVTIQGHTDSQGNAEYNQELSERRAIAAANYVAEQGVDGERMKIIGFGEEEPKYSNETELGRSQNRRVEFLITANEDMISEAEKEAQNRD